MAKKADPHSLGCTLLIIVAFLTFAIIPFVFAFGVYAFPAFLSFLLLKSRWGSIPTPELISEEQAVASTRHLLAQRDALTNEITEILNRGLGDGVRFLAAQDRFEMRSAKGQTLNRELAFAHSALNDTLSKLEMAKRPEHRKVHALNLSMGAWRRGRAFRAAFLTAALGCTVTAVSLETFVYQGRQPDLLKWNIYPSLIGPHIEIGTIAGWILGCAALAIARRHNRKIEERQGLNARYFEQDLPKLEFDANAASELETPEKPYRILGISPQASTAEIKAAYRSAIARCHPDTVADRSQGIRKAAEAESRSVNAAYDKIRNARGFM